MSAAGPTALEAHDRLRIATAAGHAKRRYPGAVGEVLAREIEGYLDFGHRFHRGGLMPRLVEEIMRPTDEALPGRG